MKFAGISPVSSREFEKPPAEPSGVGMNMALSCPYSAWDPVVGRLVLSKRPEQSS